MDKKTFDDLIKKIPQYVEQKKKEDEENDLFPVYDEEREEVYLGFWKKLYTFDQQGYKIFNNLWKKGKLQPNPDGYLCVKDAWGDLIPVHRYLKEAEVEEMAKKMKCPLGDIHVHHKDIKNPDNKFDNRFSNLEVLHKDYHAMRHGFNNWGLYEAWKKKKGLE